MGATILLVSDIQKTKSCDLKYNMKVKGFFDGHCSCVLP